MSAAGRRARPLLLHAGFAAAALAGARSPTGELAPAWTPATPAQGPGPGPFVATAPSGGRFGALVDLGLSGTAPRQGARVAFDPLSARPTVAWTALEDGKARLRVTTRETP